MTYDWKTEMRAGQGSGAPARTDGLAGQAAAIVHEDGRVTLTCMPDVGCFPADATISAEDARALCHTLLDRLDDVDVQRILVERAERKAARS